MTDRYSHCVCDGTDHSVGFGGKYGVQTDRVDKSAKGWSEKTQTELHPSQVDHKKVGTTLVCRSGGN